MKWFKSKKEKSYEYVIATTMKTLDLTREEAEKRIAALLESGVLDNGNPDDRYWQMVIENFIRFDLTKVDYKEVFMQTLAFPEFITEYDRVNNSNLTKALKDVKSDKDGDWPIIKSEIEKFDKFFHENLWLKFKKEAATESN